jgi:hypothetical protein
VTGQAGDQLQQGSEHPSPVVPRWVTAAALALLAVAGVVAVLRGDRSAGATPAAGGNTVLTPGESLVVLFNFALPRQCPAPLPVEAEVTVSGPAGSLQISQPIHLLSDLGGVEFDQC